MPTTTDPTAADILGELAMRDADHGPLADLCRAHIRLESKVDGLAAAVMRPPLDARLATEHADTVALLVEVERERDQARAEAKRCAAGWDATGPVIADLRAKLATAEADRATAIEAMTDATSKAAELTAKVAALEIANEVLVGRVEKIREMRDLDEDKWRAATGCATPGDVRVLAYDRLSRALGSVIGPPYNGREVTDAMLAHLRDDGAITLSSLAPVAPTMPTVEALAKALLPLVRKGEPEPGHVAFLQACAVHAALTASGPVAIPPAAQGPVSDEDAAKAQHAHLDSLGRGWGSWGDQEQAERADLIASIKAIRPLLASPAPLATPARTVTPALRPEVAAFAQATEARLRANDHKPGWKGDDPGRLMERLREEVDEVRDELSPTSRSREYIAAECADVANFAMMIADVCGGLAAMAPHRCRGMVGKGNKSGRPPCGWTGVPDNDDNGPACPQCGGFVVPVAPASPTPIEPGVPVVPGSVADVRAYVATRMVMAVEHGRDRDERAFRDVLQFIDARLSAPATPRAEEGREEADRQAVGTVIDGHAKRACEANGVSWDALDGEARTGAASQVHDILNHLRLDDSDEIYDGRSGAHLTGKPTPAATGEPRFVYVTAEEAAKLPPETRFAPAVSRGGVEETNRGEHGNGESWAWGTIGTDGYCPGMIHATATTPQAPGEADPPNGWVVLTEDGAAFHSENRANLAYTVANRDDTCSVHALGPPLRVRLEPPAVMAIGPIVTVKPAVPS